MMAERKYSINAIYDTVNSIGLTIVKAQFYKMLKNELYAGWLCKFGERHKGKFEPIISEEIFNRVQQVMRNKKTPLVYKSEHPDFPLRRFVIHPQKHKLTGAWSKGRNNKYAYYRFIGTRLYWPKIELEKTYEEFIDKYSFDDYLFGKLKKEILNRFSMRSLNIVRDKEALSSRKQQLKEKQRAFLQKNINGIISDSLLKEQLIVIEDEIWAIDNGITQIEEKKVDAERILQFLEEFLIHPSLTWKNLPLDIKVKLQWFQFPEGVTFDGKRFRTVKISSIFKLKQFFLTKNSPMVRRAGFEPAEPEGVRFTV